MRAELQLIAAALGLAIFAKAGATECVGPGLTEKQVLRFFNTELAKRRTSLPSDWTVKVSQDKCNYKVFAEGPTSERGAHFAYWLDRSGKVLKVFQGR